MKCKHKDDVHVKRRRKKLCFQFSAGSSSPDPGQKTAKNSQAVS